MKFYLHLVLLLAGILNVRSKPFDFEGSIENRANEIDHGSRSDYKQIPEEVKDHVSVLPAEDLTSSVKRVQPTKFGLNDRTVGKTTIVENKTSMNFSNAALPLPISWFLMPLVQKIQFSPQNFFQERLGQLKENLNNLGLADRHDGSSKQFSANNRFLNLIGLNDSGFYTNRLDPAGFFGGNGWFANKGGILGGPGAFLSTGSLLTDYPTPYRK